MKYNTYNNMVKATKMIAEKGYPWEEANDIAIQIFDEMKVQKNGMSVEWYISRIVSKKER